MRIGRSTAPILTRSRIAGAERLREKNELIGTASFAGDLEAERSRTGNCDTAQASPVDFARSRSSHNQEQR
jgi:hypothetical protein